MNVRVSVVGNSTSTWQISFLGEPLTDLNRAGLQLQSDPMRTRLRVVGDGGAADLPVLSLGYVAAVSAGRTLPMAPGFARS
jgi:hypothetical protein